MCCWAWDFPGAGELVKRTLGQWEPRSGVLWVMDLIRDGPLPQWDGWPGRGHLTVFLFQVM